ncbi:transposase [Streptomyces sp. NPDC048484]|uniref:transposase n=1 Tax=Streptomyces sp. NPDC048484 TaxID=3155146 RepID=UPI003420FB45
MAAPRKYSLELRERAVWMYRTADPKPQIKKLAVDLGVHPEALRGWIRQADAARPLGILRRPPGGGQPVVPDPPKQRAALGPGGRQHRPPLPPGHHRTRLVVLRHDPHHVGGAAVRVGLGQAQRDDQRGQLDELACARGEDLGDVLGHVPEIQPGRFRGPPGSEARPAMYQSRVSAQASRLSPTVARSRVATIADGCSSFQGTALPA